MRNRIAVLVVIATAAVPFSAQAQQRIVTENSTTGMVGVPVGGGIIVEAQRPRFRQYVIEERIPSYTIDRPIEVGTVLPEIGLTYYEVPQQFGPTTYRYTVVNERSILVDPRTRRIMQVID